MQIQSLKLFVTDADLAELAGPALVGQEGIEGVQLHLTPEGVQLSGEYQTGFGFKVTFETLWQLTPAGPALLVRLASIKVAGLPANLLRGALMRMVRDSAEEHPGLRVEEDALRIDVPEVARAHGVTLQVGFTAVRLSIGSAVLEAG